MCAIGALSTVDGSTYLKISVSNSSKIATLQEMKSSGIRPSNYTLSILVKLLLSWPGDGGTYGSGTTIGLARVGNIH